MHAYGNHESIPVGFSIQSVEYSLPQMDRARARAMACVCVCSAVCIARIFLNFITVISLLSIGSSAPDGVCVCVCDRNQCVRTQLILSDFSFSAMHIHGISTYASPSIDLRPWTKQRFNCVPQFIDRNNIEQLHIERLNSARKKNTIVKRDYMTMWQTESERLLIAYTLVDT